MTDDWIAQANSLMKLTHQADYDLSLVISSKTIAKASMSAERYKSALKNYRIIFGED